MTSGRLVLEWAILLILAMACAMLGQAKGMTAWFDNRVLDYAAAIDRPELDERITIVAIDERSLAAEGAWPWPREKHAALIDQLTSQGARLILYDVLFLEPTATVADEALATSIAGSGRVVLPHAFVDREEAIAGARPVFPLPELRAASAAVGHVAAAPDDDGVLRRFSLETSGDGISYRHFALSAADQLGETSEAIQALIEGQNPILVQYHPPDSVPALSATAVLQGSVASDFFRDRIVLVGATALGMGDRYAVASGSVSLMTGVETQANLLNALISGDFIEPVSMVWSHLVSVVVLLALFLVFWFLPPRLGLAALAGLAVAVMAFSVGMVLVAGLWLPTGALLAVLLLAYPVWSWRRLTVVSAFLDRQARLIHGSDQDSDRQSGFDYVSSQVARLRQLVGEIRDSLTFLQNVIDAAPDAILVFDREGRAVMRNDRADALFRGWHEKDRPSMQELMLAAGAEHRTGEREVRFPDGRIFALASAGIDPEPGDSDVSEIVALRDVTAARQRQEERKQMLEFLSHDMRSPQAAIIALAAENSSEEDEQGRLRRIRSQAERTLKLADDFVQLARLEQVPIEPRDVDICALVMEACDRAYAAAKAARLECEQEFPDEPVFALVDESLIARALDNLIGNAIKFSPAGSTVSVRVGQESTDTVVIEIRDQGPGLPSERLSNPFGRFGAHSKSAGPSVGLGLAFVKRVVDLHNAEISVASHSRGEQQGTAFTVTLPVEGSVA